LIAAGLSPFAPEAAAIKAGKRNFEAHYRHAVDTWVRYDNAGDEPVVIDWSERK